MTLAVTDVRGTAENQIEMAAKAVGKSPHRRAVFQEIHSGKKRVKTVDEIASATSLPRKRVLEEAVKLVHKQIISKTRLNGDTAYERDNFYYAHRNEILRPAHQPKQSGTRNHAARARNPSRKVVPRIRLRARQRRSVQKYDTFLAHASEDKTTVARPLYRALTKAGVTVWFDEAVLTIGDSLRHKIDEGLSRCRFGIVILSPKFFSKHWTRQELDGLVARENASGEKVILPIWHKLTRSGVTKFSPTLAGRLAGNSDEGITSLARKIKEVVKASTRPRSRIT